MHFLKDLSAAVHPVLSTCLYEGQLELVFGVLMKHSSAGEWCLDGYNAHGAG